MDTSKRSFAVKCRECKEYKHRIWSGRFKKERTRLFVDDTKRLWNGLQCPDCKYAPKNRVFIKKDDQSIMLENIDLDPLSKRCCRVCQKLLPVSRYFMHEACTPSIDYYDMSEAYAYHV